MGRPWEMEDGEGEVEVRLKLPPGMGAAEAARLLRVDAKTKSLAVLFKDGRPPLLPETELYEKVRAGEAAWYCEGGSVVVSLPKQFPQKWPALTDEEALEKRFGPIRTSSLPKPKAQAQAQPLSQPGGEAPGQAGGAPAAGGAEEKGGANGAQAWAAKSLVEALLRCAQVGDVPGLRRATATLLAAEQQEEAQEKEKSAAGEARDATSVPEAAGTPPASTGGSGEKAGASGPDAGSSGPAQLREVVEGVRDGNGRTALHFAASKGQLAACQYLVGEVGVAADPADDEGETPLMLAARDDHAATVRFLLEHGANPCAANTKSGAQAVHHAAGHGNLGVLKLLLEWGRPSEGSKEGAAAAGVQEGGGPVVDVNAMSEAGPPLLWACGHGKESAVEMLLAHGADPNVPSEDGITALLTACAAGETSIVKRLTAAGAQVNEGGTPGATPLFIAATEGNMEMLQCLLSAGADPNTLDEDGKTAVQVAGTLGLEDVVKCLLPLTKRPESAADPDEWTVEALLQGSSSLAEPAPAAPPGAAAATTDATSRPRGSGEQGSVPAEVESGKQRADDLFKATKFMEAIDAYTQAIDLLPAEVRAPAEPATTPEEGDSGALPPTPLAETAGALFSNRSLCWMRAGQPQQALEDAQNARRLRPAWGKACYREGSALQLLGRYEDAANAFFEGVQRDPDNLELAKAFQLAIQQGKEAHAESVKREAQKGGQEAAGDAK